MMAAGETHGKSWITIFLLNLPRHKNAKYVFRAQLKRKTKIVLGCAEIQVTFSSLLACEEATVSSLTSTCISGL